MAEDGLKESCTSYEEVDNEEEDEEKDDYDEDGGGVDIRSKAPDTSWVYITAETRKIARARRGRGEERRANEKPPCQPPKVGTCLPQIS